MADQLRALRAATEGLDRSGHYDLGVAFMGMGLVDEAVREFSKAGVQAPTGNELPPRPESMSAKPSKKPAAKAKKPAKPAKKAKPGKKERKAKKEKKDKKDKKKSKR